MLKQVQHDGEDPETVLDFVSILHNIYRHSELGSESMVLRCWNKRLPSRVRRSWQ